jgi:hypothetical protein
VAVHPGGHQQAQPHAEAHERQDAPEQKVSIHVAGVSRHDPRREQHVHGHIRRQEHLEWQELRPERDDEHRGAEPQDGLEREREGHQGEERRVGGAHGFSDPARP